MFYFDITKYCGKYAMHCKTEKEAKEFCKFLHECGRKWYSGESYAETTNFDVYKSNTIYFFNEGLYGKIGYKEDEYTTLEFDNFIISDENIAVLNDNKTKEITDDEIINLLNIAMQKEFTYVPLAAVLNIHNFLVSEGIKFIKN